jgi:hypothetical protein
LGKQKNGEVHDWWGVNNRKWNLLIDQIVPEHDDLADHVENMRKWTNHVDMAAVEWIVTMREGMRLEKEYPNDVLRVTYENICKQPEREMMRITRFCEFGEDKVFLDYCKSTLRAVKPKKPFSLAKEIEYPFLETMKELGYKI